MKRAGVSVVIVDGKPQTQGQLYAMTPELKAELRRNAAAVEAIARGGPYAPCSCNEGRVWVRSYDGFLVRCWYCLEELGDVL